MQQAESMPSLEETVEAKLGKSAGDVDYEEKPRGGKTWAETSSQVLPEDGVTVTLNHAATLLPHRLGWLQGREELEKLNRSRG